VAQYNLGVCYYHGYGVTQDYKQAVYWYTKAANQGYAMAQYNLGVCYDNGFGVTQDYKQAVCWYTKAANQGNAMAQCNLGVCYDNGSGVTQDYKQAVYWYTKAANQGYAMAQNNLGVCYYHGNGVTQDYKQAVYWYTKAANQGVDVAQNNLGACYYDGEGVTQDYKQAVYWYTKAANQGYAAAQSNLGDCYLQGKGVDEDDKQAFFWHSKAADQGHAWSQMRLGYFYYSGEGVNKDYGQARYWSDKALNNPKASELAKTFAEMTILFLDDDKGSTTNTTSSNGQASQNTSTSSKPTANTVVTNLSKGEWRTSMRKVVDNVTEKYSDDVYKGQKSNGKRNGMGVYRWNSGSYYFGEWSNGDMNGYGLRVCGEGRAISNCPDCVYFVGNWKDDKKSGKGTCYDEYGNLIYYGDFANDRPTGTYPTTESYSSYKFECINYESNNSVYIGETKDGKRHGYGVYIWNNWYGNAWYGHWENDKRSGNGIDLFYDGSIKYGRWDGDEYYKPSSNPTNNNSTSNTTTNTATSKPNTTTATTDKKYTRWPYYYSNPVFGLHFGYVQRAMKIEGIDARYNVFGEVGGMNGFQAGFFFHLFKKSLVGLAFGVNYEMYFASGSSSQNYYSKYKEINLYAPLDLTFHIPFSPESAMYLHGGLGFDYSCYNKFTYPNETNIYGRNALDRFNLSYEYGLDVKIKGIMLHANYQKGITTHYPFGFDRPTKLNKFSVGMSFVF